MEFDLLKSLASALGLAGLVAGIFYLLYRQLLALKIFSKMSSGQTFALVTLVAVLVWILAMATLVDFGPFAVVSGDGNVTTQGTGQGSGG